MKKSLLTHDPFSSSQNNLVRISRRKNRKNLNRQRKVLWTDCLLIFPWRYVLQHSPPDAAADRLNGHEEDKENRTKNAIGTKYFDKSLYPIIRPKKATGQQEASFERN